VIAALGSNRPKTREVTRGEGALEADQVEDLPEVLEASRTTARRGRSWMPAAARPIGLDASAACRA
jgi:hypothetical protein